MTGVAGVMLPVAVVPSAPALVPALTGAAAGELDGLRAACDEAVGALLSSAPSRLLVLGAGPVSRDWPDDAPATFRGFVAGDAPGLDVPPLSGAAPAGERLPLPLALGRWLLGRAAAQGARLPGTVLWRTVPDGSAALPAADAVLAVADLAASHGAKAPRAEHPGAPSYDDSVVSALASGDLGLLGDVDAELGRAVGAGGGPVWSALATTRATGAGHVLWRGAPYGVGYVVATVV